MKKIAALAVVAACTWSAPCYSADPASAEELKTETPRSETTSADAIISTSSKQKDKLIAGSYSDDSPFALVSIRFPAEYSPNFLRNLNRLGNFRRDTLATLRAFADEQILKSAYSASEFYDYLIARLPRDSVILEPMKLSFDASGTVACAPIRKAIPSLISVDLFAGINANRVRTPFASNKGDDTFADAVSLFANISRSSEPSAFCIAAVPVFDADNKRYGMTIEKYYNVICNGDKVKIAPASSSTSGKTKKQSSPPVVQANTPALDGFLPLMTGYKCPTKTITEPERLIDGEGDVPCMRLWDAYAAVVLQSIEKEDLKKAKARLMASYIDDIDPEIAELLERGYDPDNGSLLNQRKLDVLSRYMENERKQIFSLVSQRTEESLYSGELGDSLRALAKSELEFARKKKASKRRQYAAEAIGLAAGAGSLVASLTLPTAAFSNLLTTVSFASVGAAQNEGRLQQKLRDVFQQFERQADGIQTTFLLKFGSDALEVTGNNIDELRSKFRSKYQEQFEAYNPGKGGDL